MGYDSAVATAKAVLTRRGKSVVVKRTGLGAADEITGTRAEGGDKTSVFKCVGLPPQGRSAEYRIGSLIGRNILQFYMARVAGDIELQPGDIVPWGGKNYTLVWTATYDPDASGTIFVEALGEV